MLTVFIDFKSPEAMLAITPTLDLADRLQLQVTWHPFLTKARDIPILGKTETVGESHRRVRAASQQALAIKYASLQGIDLQFPAKASDTDLALAVLADLDGDPLPFIRAAFDAYWTAHADLNDRSVVQDIIAQTTSHYTGDFDVAAARLDAAMDHADQVGIVGAPGYLIDGQVFVGREHLPWIEEIARAKLAPTG